MNNLPKATNTQWPRGVLNKGDDNKGELDTHYFLDSSAMPLLELG